MIISQPPAPRKPKMSYVVMMLVRDNPQVLTKASEGIRKTSLRLNLTLYSAGCSYCGFTIVLGHELRVACDRQLVADIHWAVK